MLKCCGSARPCSKNQRWIGVSGALPFTGPCSAWIAGPLEAARASSAIVWCSKSWRGRRRRPARVARAMIWRPRIESPPSEKKLSWIPIGSFFSAAAQMPASSFSVSDSGAAKAARSWAASGSGSRWRSILPFGVTGNSSSNSIRDGTIESGSRVRACSRRAWTVGTMPFFPVR